MDELINLIYSLHRFERNILVNLSKESTILELEEKTNLNEVQIIRGAQGLVSKGLIIIKEKDFQQISLTKRGKEILIKGLPELRFLIELQSKNNQSFQMLKKVIGLNNNEFNKAIGFTRKNKLIDINNGIIKINELGIKYLKEEKNKEILLKKLDNINDKKFIKKNKEIILEFKERGLVLIEQKINRTFLLTPLGIKLLKRKKEFREDLIEKNETSLIKSKEYENKIFRRYTVKENLPKKFFGKAHPYQKFINDMKRLFVSIGFKEMKGKYVENNFTNCDALYMPQDHPARGIHDIFYIKDPEKTDLKQYKKFVKNVKKAHEEGINESTGWGVDFDEEVSKQHVLRSQTTSASIRTLMSKDLEIPGKYFIIDRVVRPDVIDKTHGAEFVQLEGIVLGEKMNFKNLLSLLRMFAKDIIKAKKFLIMPDYYPYTEPSASLHCFVNGRWMELGGAGMFRKEVTGPAGVKVPVIAWGLGFDRAFMSNYGLKDIREIFTSDINWLRNAEVTK